jgi:hypothetical protein
VSAWIDLDQERFTHTFHRAYESSLDHFAGRHRAGFQSFQPLRKVSYAEFQRTPRKMTSGETDRVQCTLLPRNCYILFLIWSVEL